jgi:hypothetical protein
MTIIEILRDNSQRDQMWSIFYSHRTSCCSHFNVSILRLTKRKSGALYNTNKKVEAVSIMFTMLKHITQILMTASAASGLDSLDLLFLYLPNIS